MAEGSPARPEILPSSTAPVTVAADATALLGRPTGIGHFAREVITRLGANEGIDLRLFAMTWRGRDRLAAAAEAMGIGPERVRTRPLPARPSRELWKRADVPPIEWWTGAVDVVWGPNFVVPPTSSAAQVVTVHDLTPVHFPELSTRDTLDYPTLVRRAAGRGAWIQTDSEAVATEVRHWLGLPPDRVVAVPLGVTPMEGGRADRGRLLAGADRYVLALGTVEPRKDLPTLVRAFDRLAADDASLHLVVAGPDGWGVAQFDTAVQAARHRGRIRRLGWVDDAGRADLLAGARCLAFPSRYEGFGLPPLEAMAAGVPVVTSDLPVLSEVSAGAALHVPVGDAEALAQAIARLERDRGLRHQLVQAGRSRAADYSWDNCARGVAALLQRVAAATGPAKHR